MTEKVNIVMVKMNTADGEDMALSTQQRFEIWQNAVEYANSIDNDCDTVVVAPEYFLVEPAIKRSVVVNELRKFHQDRGIIRQDQNGKDYDLKSYTGQIWDICTMLGISSNDKSISAILNDYEEDYPMDENTYYLSSRALPPELWKVYKAHFKAELDHSSIMLIPGTSVYKKPLKDKKAHKLEQIKPWEAQLPCATVPDLFRNKPSLQNMEFIKKLAEHDANGIRNRAMVIMPNSQEIKKFYKHIELSEVTGTLVTSGKIDAVSKGALVGEYPGSTLFVKGQRSLDNYIFESGTAKHAIEICADHMHGIAKSLYTEEGREPDCHMHFILSATCEHIKENLLLVDGGILVHCDANYTDNNKFGVFKKSTRLVYDEESTSSIELTKIEPNLQTARYCAWLEVNVVTKN